MACLYLGHPEALVVEAARTEVEELVSAFETLSNQASPQCIARGELRPFRIKPDPHQVDITAVAIAVRKCDGSVVEIQ